MQDRGGSGGGGAASRREAHAPGWADGDQPLRLDGRGRRRRHGRAAAAGGGGLDRDRPLSEFSPPLDPAQDIDGLGTSLALYVREWKRHFKPMLSATAIDLLTLHGVGERRRAGLVDLVMCEAIESAEIGVKPRQQ